MEAFALGTLSGLVVGLVGGWFGHILAGRRFRHEGKVTDELALLDKCGEVFSARIKYVVAFHRGGPRYIGVRDEYLDTKRRYRWADPEVVLKGTPEWDQYMIAERDARRDVKTVPTNERVKSVETASYAVVDALAKRRTEVRR